MSEPNLQKYLGWWIPISKWVDSMNTEDFDILHGMARRLRIQGILASVVLDRGKACVYREVIEKDIAGEGQSFHEWAKGIQAHAVESVEGVRYSRNTG